VSAVRFLVILSASEDETLAPVQWAGAAPVLAGVMLVTLRPR